jgi:hypothetical protein
LFLLPVCPGTGLTLRRIRSAIFTFVLSHASELSAGLPL